MRGIPVELPECGILIGNGVYPLCEDRYVSALTAHRGWVPITTTPDGMIDLIISQNQGNMAQVWGHSGGAPHVVDKWFYRLDELGITIPPPDWENEKYLTRDSVPEFKEHADRFGVGLLRFINSAASKGIYTTFIYASADPKWSHQFKDAGSFYQGYDFGERYSFRFDLSKHPELKLEDVTLDMIVDELMGRVTEHVTEYHTNGWGNVAATSSNFFIDIEVAAGADIPMVEDMAFRHLNVASALSRGLYGQFELPIWGSHVAHEHYSWIPWQCKYKFPLLRSVLYHKYMAGAKMIVNESGNWYVQAHLCEDSPNFELPVNPIKHEDLRKPGANPVQYKPYIEEARKHYHKINGDSQWSKNYRKEVSDFYDYIKANGTPAGQPERTIAVAKGNLDLASYMYNPNQVIGGMREVAEKIPGWFASHPERGWEIVKQVFFPLLPVMGDYPNHFLSGTPWGQTDIVSFIKDMVTPEYLSANYKALLFSGWNTSSEKQYEILKKYVHQGGILFISIPHLSTNNKRNFISYTVDDLVNKGDFSELCGVIVKGPTRGVTWAVPTEGSNVMGVKYPRRFGIIGSKMGDIEFTDPDVEILVTDDERAHPLLFRRKYGKGMVYFLNSWSYPGAMNTDDGPGARVSSKGLIGTIYQHIAGMCRGKVYITDDGQTTGLASEYICYSYFPEAGKICLQNVDFDHERSFYLHQEGSKPEHITLKPSEFVQRDAAASLKK